MRCVHAAFPQVVVGFILVLVFIDRFVRYSGKDGEFLVGGDGSADDAVYLSDSHCALFCDDLPMNSI